MQKTKGISEQTLLMWHSKLGNVLSTVSDRKRAVAGTGALIDHWQPEVVSSTDYYPFGMQMAGRSFASKGYRWGFQGQEEDRETGWVNYTYRMHDPRRGRFFAVDPLAGEYPWNSTYAFSENRVMSSIELEGLEAVDLASFDPNLKGATKQEIARHRDVTGKAGLFALGAMGGGLAVGLSGQAYNKALPYLATGLLKAGSGAEKVSYQVQAGYLSFSNKNPKLTSAIIGGIKGALPTGPVPEVDNVLRRYAKSEAMELLSEVVTTAITSRSVIPLRNKRNNNLQVGNGGIEYKVERDNTFVEKPHRLLVDEKIKIEASEKD